MSDAIKSHRAFALLLAIAAAVRLLTMLAYRPALLFSDSWGYLFAAFSGHPLAVSYQRPYGYPILIRLLTTPGRDLVELVTFQHLSGIACGAAVYFALDRAGVHRVISIGAAALVLLDGYRITLEQYVMPDAFFSLTLLLSALALLWPELTDEPHPPRPLVAAIAGLLLAAAAIQRQAALFVLPAFAAYLIWRWVGWRALVAFAVALAVPLLGYWSLNYAKIGVFGFTENSGWTLYGRVAGFADCARAGIPAAQRPLCETSAERASHPTAPTWYIWDGSSPAEKLFHGGHQTRQAQARSNAVLSSFAHRIVLNQPLDYIGASLADALRYFTPGATPFNDAVSATSLPVTADAEADSEQVRRQVLPAMHPQVRAPARLVRDYRSVVHVPRPVLALLALISIVALALRRPRRREVLLLSGSALLLLFGTAATAGFGLRYLLPAVPLLAIGGSLALGDLLVRGRWR